MEPASIKMVKAFVTNKGELTDRISLSINVPFDSDMGGMMNDPNIQEAEPGETANFSFILTTTQNIDDDEVIITVTATSGEALDFGIDYEEELKVKVIIFVEEEAKPERFSEWLFFWGILIIIIVTILALLILILFRRKKQEQETLPEDKTDILKLLETPTIEQTQETLPEKDTATPKTLDVTTPKPVQENLQEEQHEPDQPTISHEEQKEGEEEICE
jgi:cytoskeletal protein RodZ